MVNFESEMPFFYWTFDRLGDLEQAHNPYRFDGSVWRADAILSYEIGETDVTFDSPADWAKGLPPVRFHRTADGRYEHRAEGVIYEAVRADTNSHVVLTGRWYETGSGKGVFIAVLPVNRTAEILLETTATVPIESVVPEMVANPEALPRFGRTDASGRRPCSVATSTRPQAL